MAYKTLKPGDVKSVIALYKAGVCTKDIAAQNLINVRTVQRLIKKFRDNGEVALPHPEPKSGRPRKLTQQTLRVICRQIKSKPSLTAREIKDKNPILLSEVSLRTIQLRMHDDLQFRSYKARPKPLLNERHRKNRLKFCKKYRNWNEEDWKKVLWTDEATFFVTGMGAKRVYRRSGTDPNLPQYILPTVKHPTSVMIWGSFAYGGVGKLVYLPPNETMNQYKYYELLNDELEESFEMSGATFFMHDGAPCHTAKLVTAWLTDAYVPYFNDWPGQSPDINPIENLWAIIKQKLRGMDTSTLPKLKSSIQDVWDNIPKNILENLAMSVPKRLKECIKKNGGSTKY